MKFTSMHPIEDEDRQEDLAEMFDDLDMVDNITIIFDADGDGQAIAKVTARTSYGSAGEYFTVELTDEQAHAMVDAIKAVRKSGQEPW